MITLLKFVSANPLHAKKANEVLAALKVYFNTKLWETKKEIAGV